MKATTPEGVPFEMAGLKASTGRTRVRVDGPKGEMHTFIVKEPSKYERLIEGIRALKAQLDAEES